MNEQAYRAATDIVIAAIQNNLVPVSGTPVECANQIADVYGIIYNAIQYPEPPAK
ncbi:MAG TPA: hypothetical protein VK973_02035 [Arenicellales bacterium]|nr:hypothetical protein [Arenicellales bacterium]